MSQPVIERPIKPRSRAKAREGLLVLQQETRSQRRATDAAAAHVLGQLHSQPGHRKRLAEVMADAVAAGHSQRRTQDAVFRLKALGRVTVDPTTSTVQLRVAR